MLESFAANILDGTPLIAPGSDGITGVRPANAIHLSSWTGAEVPLDFDEDAYLAELNKRIRAEGHVCREMISVPRGWHDRRTSGTTRSAAPCGGPG